MKIGIFSILFIFQLILSPLVFTQTKQSDKGAGIKVVSVLPSKEKRFAMIIGVDTYQKDISPLYGTVNDAKALRDVLIKYAGFTDERIILMTTASDDPELLPTRGNIIDQLDKLSRLVPADGLLLFSFSGHGVSIGSDAFLVPSDGRIYQNSELMRERAIDVLRIKQAIQATKVKQVIMFLDACRNDPVRAKGDIDNNLTTAYTKGFSFETKNRNIEAYATLYATSFGDRAYEFLDKKTNKYRGYFNYAIEEGLKGSAANDKGEVTLAGLIRYIEDTVKERVRIFENQRQIPYPATEGFRNSDLVIALTNKSDEITLTDKSTAKINTDAIPAQKDSNSSFIKDSEWLSLLLRGETNKVIQETTNYLSKNRNDIFALKMRLLAYTLNNGENNKAYSDASSLNYLLKNPKTFEDYDAFCEVKTFSKRIIIRSNVLWERPSENAVFLKEIKFACQQAISLDKNSPLAYINMAIINSAEGNHEFALIDLNKALQINPQIYWAYLEKGEVYSAMKNPEEAIKNYGKAIELNPNFAKAFLLRGKAYQNRKSYDLALSDYARFLSLDDKSREACSVFKNRAKIFEITGNKDQMIIDLKNASDLESFRGSTCFGDF